MRMALALAGLLIGAGPACAQADPWASLTIWVDAIEQHGAGRNDDAVRAVAEMPPAAFDAAVPYMVFLIHEALGRPGTSGFDDLFRRLYREIRLTPSDARRLEGLIGRASVPRLRDFFRRAALLHTDVTLFHSDANLTSAEGRGRLASDGRGEGELERPWHWMLARSFLHLLVTEWVNGKPALNADADPAVRVWYQAVANHFWSMRNYTEGLPHIRRALELFPRDAEIQFVRGLIHESQSGGQIQAAVAEQAAAVAKAPGMIYVPTVGSEAVERRDAEDAFRLALAADPHHFEARLRLAHILTRQERYDEAARELAIVLATAEHPWHRYFAFLLAGRAEEGRGLPERARAAYQSAAALFPYAQSPRLALSQLDLRVGDRDAAIGVLAFLAGERPPDGDPWWQYDAVRTPEAAGAWIRRLRAAFAEPAR